MELVMINEMFMLMKKTYRDSGLVTKTILFYSTWGFDPEMDQMRHTFFLNFFTV